MFTKQLPLLALASAAMLLPSLSDAADRQGRQFQRLVDEAHAKYKGLTEGKNADYIPILATIPSDLFAVVIVDGSDGRVYQAGDADYKFSIQSVSKPFTAALVMAQQGPQAIHEKIGVEPTGLPFNSRMAITSPRPPVAWVTSCEPRSPGSRTPQPTVCSPTASTTPRRTSSSSRSSRR
jgi:glutaminase